MNIGSIGKAIANQALESTKKSVIDSVVGPEKPKTAEAAPAAAPKPAAAPSLDIGSIIVSQVQAMQRPLREDQELQVWVRAAHEVLRVTEVFVPHSAVLVFAGTDNQGNVTRVLMPADQVQLVCKIVPVLSGMTVRRVNVVIPKPRPETPSAPPAPSPAQNS